MATTTLTIRLDMTAMDAAIEDLTALGRALVSRHGEAFRALDRRLTDVAEGRVSPFPLKKLNNGELMIGMPPEVTSLLRDARALGVI